ncbi:lytic transglycosylase domain-containing protein [Agaribacterium sp. ZY112]|uniref:lytic murein transglycosylase n=1 Tax=Agaribacterium sp. ZY112 TaxID=3233574 RepID=UPI00352632C2
MIKRALLACMMFSCSVFAENSPDFDVWLEQLKSEALSKGISQSNIDRAFAHVQFKKRVIKSDRKQAEFTESYHDYIERRVGDVRVKQGQAYLKKNLAKIEPIAQRYGVPARFIVAIIGVETNYGSYKLSHDLFNVLSTLAYDKRRGARFRKEIFASLEMIETEQASFEQLKSSWAGALGVPQFMPSTYLQYAVDYNGDGKKDIWTEGPDLYASVANYLSSYGWDEKRSWARKVIVPPKKLVDFEEETQNYAEQALACKRYDKHLKGWRSLGQWDQEGITRMNGWSLPKVEVNASLIITNPELSHGYLVYNNFCVLMRYNPSFKYALSVGVLADRLK